MYIADAESLGWAEGSQIHSPHLAGVLAAPRIHLRHFRPDEIKLDPQEAGAVLRFIFRGRRIPPRLTMDDRGFAQALLIEAIDRSLDMSFVERLFKKFYMRIPGTPLSTMSKIVQAAVAHAWLRSRPRGLALEEVRIYESVRATLARNFISAWNMRMQGLPLTY